MPAMPRSRTTPTTSATINGIHEPGRAVGGDVRAGAGAPAGCCCSSATAPGPFLDATVTLVSVCRTSPEAPTRFSSSVARMCGDTGQVRGDDEASNHRIFVAFMRKVLEEAPDHGSIARLAAHRAASMAGMGDDVMDANLGSLSDGATGVRPSSSRVGDDHLVDVYVGHVRRRLGDDANEGRLVRTVRGVGYRTGTRK